MKIKSILATASAIVALASGSAMATPSTQIWIPSTDAKDFKNFHIDIDNYARFSSQTDALTNMYNIGLSAGVLPLDNLKLEVGVDFLKQDVKAADDHPFYFNAKLATPEDRLARCRDRGRAAMRPRQVRRGDSACSGWNGIRN